MTFRHNLRLIRLSLLLLTKVRESKNLTPITQIHLYSQCNRLDFLLYLHSVYGGGTSLKACTVAYRPFLSVYWTESVESHCEVMCNTHLGFNQAEDFLPQTIQEIETYNLMRGTICIYACGTYWLLQRHKI